jgi:hypothetical protein
LRKRWKAAKDQAVSETDQQVLEGDDVPSADTPGLAQHGSRIFGVVQREDQQHHVKRVIREGDV